MLTEEGYDVVCFLGNVGQEEDWAAVEAKALKIGAKKMIIEDLRREFITELCFPAIRKTASPATCPDLSANVSSQSAMPSTRAATFSVRHDALLTRPGHQLTSSRYQLGSPCDCPRSDARCSA